MARVKQQDIANILNVSRITVSKALRDYPDISSKMKKRVLDAAKDLGYVPDFTGRNLQGKKTFTIGVVIPDISNSFFSFAVHGIMDAAANLGYHIILTASREKAEIEKENILTLLSMRVDGLLVAISKETGDIKIFETAKKIGTPIVFFDRVIKNIGISCVGIDDRKAATQLVDYLIKSGYRKIAHLAGSLKVEIGRNRLDGYLDSLKKFDIPIREEWIIEGAFDDMSGYEGFKKLLKCRELPEVIFSVNDRAAQGAYRAMKEAGLSIPDDIGIAAFGHSKFADILSPSLTIINCPPDVLGQQALELLIKEIKSEQNDPINIILDTTHY